MKFNLLPIYQDISKGEVKPNKADLLKQIPTDAIIRSCCHINAELFNAENALKKEIDIFFAIIGRIKDEKRNAFYKDNLMEFVNREHGTTIGIFPVVHVLKLIEESFMSFIQGTFKETTAEQELGVLKLLLIENDEANERLKNNLKNVVEDSEKMYQLFWTNLLPTGTFLHKKSYTISMYKALRFLKYLESKYPSFIKTYIDFNEVDSPIVIIMKLFEINANGYNRERNGYCSYFTNNVLSKNFVAQNLTL